MGRQEYIDSIKNALVTLGKKAVLSYLGTALPFLNIPILRDIISILVERIFIIAITKTEFGVFAKYIDLRTSAQGRDFESAAINYNRLKQFGTQEEKKNAEKEFLNSARAFFSLSN